MLDFRWTQGKDQADHVKANIESCKQILLMDGEEERLKEEIAVAMENGCERLAVFASLGHMIVATKIGDQQAAEAN
jgi:hypothetical protein